VVTTVNDDLTEKLPRSAFGAQFQFRSLILDLEAERCPARVMSRRFGLIANCLDLLDAPSFGERAGNFI
jgi:hypothetical protein